MYGCAAIDHGGRIADQRILAALGWSQGTRLACRDASGLVLVTNDPYGPAVITDRGHLALPAAVRRTHGLPAGARVLLTADPDQETLAVHPPGLVEAMVTGFHAYLLGGERG